MNTENAGRSTASYNWPVWFARFTDELTQGQMIDIPAAGGV